MIHGQCIVRVIKDFRIDRIIGVDNFTAGNPVLKNIYKMAMPPRIEGGIYTEEEAADEIRKSMPGRESVLLLFKDIQAALRLFKAVDGLPKELNIGPMSSRKNTKKATMYAYLTDDEIKAICEIADMGIRVYFNQTIDQKTEEWEKIRARVI